MPITTGVEGDEEQAPKSELKNMISMSVEDLNRIIDNKLKEAKKDTDQTLTVEAIKAIVEASTRKKTDREIYGYGQSYVEVDEMDPEDLIENGKAFYCFANGYVLIDDLRKGVPTLNPLGKPMYFKYVHTQRRMNGREEEIIPLSIYVSHSKKEVKWIMDHSRFDTKFFEEIGSSLDYSSRRADKMGKFHSSIRGMVLGDLIKSCNIYGIKTNINVEKMRIKLAQVFTDQALDQEEGADKRRAMDAAKSKLLTKA